MSAAPTPAEPVTLDNCDREPIHIPGRVQDHGALLAFDAAGRLCHASANASGLLGVPLPALGETLAAAHFGGAAQVHAALAAGVAALQTSDGAPEAHEVDLAGRRYDLIAHTAGPVVVLEFEPRSAAGDALTAFALQAHRAIGRLQRLGSIEALLPAAVHALRALCGFDRVMAYRFRADDSGDIVAEACVPELESFVGRRYPASDIPAQARRLYLINTLRLIADTRSAPVPVASADGSVLDMSHCVLRSVSPVHIEYLHNLGVGASMSVSLVVHGRLWGMLACHHRAPLHVPYSVRMACEVLAQIVSANVQSLLARVQAGRAAEAARLRSRLVERLLHADDALLALSELGGELLQSFGAGALVCVEAGKLVVQGGIGEPAAGALVQWLREQGGSLGDQLLALRSLESLPAALREALGSWCGVLALRYDATANGWLILLRKEQIETIAWGGRPEKEYVNGPLGPRLTPRGSFDVWRETVRGTAEPWDADELEFARDLQSELLRASASRLAELHEAKNQLLAMLGHDLRDPLQSISMAATVLQRGRGEDKLGERIQTSSSRMQRLIGQVLDLSRLQGGLGLGMEFEAVPLAALIEDLLDESRMAHPGVEFVRQLPRDLVAEVDASRFAQLVGNLLSNARHHGAAGEPIVVQLAERAGTVELEVSNTGPAIDAETEAQLFSPFKRAHAGQPRNKSGLGLGLYIAQQIALAHGGGIEYSFADPYVVFTVRIPKQRPPADA